jgi:hypothetical protein
LFWTTSPTRMSLLIWLGVYFQAKTLGHTLRPLAGLWVPFWSIWGCPNAPKQHIKTVFWLFWTISSTRMSLLIWLGPYFQAKILGRASRPLGGLCKPFWVHLGCPNAPKQHGKSYFLVVLDYFSSKNGPIDLVRSSFSSQDIGLYISSTCGPLCTFLGPLRGTQMPQNSIKNNIFRLFWTVSPIRKGLLI